jgi:hypothetical protein
LITAIQKLVSWFQSQCDGDWEHGEGIVIQSLDNPGWWIRIGLEGTSLEETPFLAVNLQRTETDWLVAKKVGEILDINCGPGNLEEALTLFLDWEESSIG